MMDDLTAAIVDLDNKEDLDLQLLLDCETPTETEVRQK